MYRTLTVVEARRSFADTLKRAADGESLLISRRGKPLAAIISPSEAIRYFRFRADELGALVERDPALNGNRIDDALVANQEDAAQQAAEGVTGEAPAPATVATNQPERAPAESTIDEGFRRQIEECIGKCHVAGTPAGTVVSEVLRICGQFGVTEEIAERLVARTYTERE